MTDETPSHKTIAERIEELERQIMILEEAFLVHDHRNGKVVTIREL